MKIFPAIDLYEGKAVRLLKGDYEQMTIYSEQPLAVAHDFEAAGADCLHLVDLEGARLGTTPNLALVTKLAQETSLFTEIGGGIRSMETLERYLDAGATRLVLGSALVRDPAFCEAAVAAHADNIVAGIDAKDGMVAIEGWREGTSTPAVDLVAELKDRGIHELVYTDIARDGMQTGIDAAAYGRLAQVAGFPITASGGVATLADIYALGELPAGSIDGVITGRAIYEGAFTVEDGIAACEEASARC